MTESLWAITCYFDPFNSRHRLAAFHEFRRRLSVPLVVVELAFDGNFQLSRDDADVLIQVRGGSILWQKERLLNLALGALPAHVEAVAWLDCDIAFLREHWSEAVTAELREYAIVQPFRWLRYQRCGEPVERGGHPADDAFESAACRLVHGKLPDDVYQMPGLSQRLRYAPGIAWAARRSLLDAHGLYDAGVIGGGDKLIFLAAVGRYQRVGRWMGPAHQRHFNNWARPFSNAVSGRISYVDGEVVHLWHGDLEGRRYYERLQGFEEFEFDPDHDLARTPEGIWQWNSAKPELHAFVRDQLSMVAEHSLAFANGGRR